MKSNIKSRDHEIEALMKLRDEDIDTSDIPEVTDWSKAIVGKFYRPLKESITIRLDVDMVAWLKSEGPGYQTRINALLREIMTSENSHCRSKMDEPSVERAAPPAYSFPSLENRKELAKCSRVARVIERRRSFFASAA